MQLEVRKVVSDGAIPVASALTKDIDNLKLHERQEIVDPLYYRLLLRLCGTGAVAQPNFQPWTTGYAARLRNAMPQDKTCVT